jgi:hypothetical protein
VSIKKKEHPDKGPPGQSVDARVRVKYRVSLSVAELQCEEIVS